MSTENFKDKTFFHIGPPRDFGLFNNFKKNKIQNIIIEKRDNCF